MAAVAIALSSQACQVAECSPCPWPAEAYQQRWHYGSITSQCGVLFLQEGKPAQPGDLLVVEILNLGAREGDEVSLRS